MSAPVLFTCDLHSSVYFHLAATPGRPFALTHLDAHCDLKGTIIDVENGRAWLRDPRLCVSTSTYLSRLVADTIVCDVEWIHDEIGGRDNDLGTVLYTSDLERLPYRWFRRPAGPGVPLAYRFGDFGPWRHRDAERVLDIDWDFFADPRKTVERSAVEIERLLEEKIEVAPNRTYVAYSPYYCRPGRAAYDEFVDRLARRLSARVEAIPEAPSARAGSTARALPLPLRRLLRRQALRLKRVLMRRAGS